MSHNGRTVAAVVLALFLVGTAGLSLAATGLPGLLVVRVPVSTPDDSGSSPTERHVAGMQIVRVAPDGHTRVLTEGFYSACEPSLSFDGQSILFAGQRTANESWQIWRVAVDGGEAVQITRGEGHSFSPLWVGSLFHLDDDAPTHRFVYVDSSPKSPAPALYSADLDGGRPWRISHNLGADFDPEVLANGRVVYSSTRASSPADPRRGTVVLLAVSNDGTDLMPFYGNHETPQRREMVRAGDDGRAYFIEGNEAAWPAGGDLAFVSLRRPLHSHTVLARGQYVSPCPLADGRLLVSKRTDDQAYALWQIDAQSGEPLTEIYAAPGWHCVDAHELAPRPRVHGRSSVVNMKKPNGVFYCLSSHISDRPGVAEASRPATTLRVLAAGADADEYELGVVPLEADGSFHIEVPASTPVRFQLVDAAGATVAEQHSWTWVMPHEKRGCIGCHEDRELAPPNVLAAAVVKPAVVLPRNEPEDAP